MKATMACVSLAKGRLITSTLSGSRDQVLEAALRLAIYHDALVDVRLDDGTQFTVSPEGLEEGPS